MVQPYLKENMQAHSLPDSFAETITRWYQPLAKELATACRQQNTDTHLLGVQGTQGSGKSTLADFLSVIFSHDYQLRCAVLSIDDFYLTRKERLSLAESTHPLLVTRGVPGTHDVNLAKQTIKTLKKLEPGQSMRLVRFDKAIDDRAPESDWPVIEGPIDIIILEGWCVGVQPQSPSALLPPINDLERDEDPEAVWRNFVNRQLQDNYQSLFNQIDKLIVLNAPSFDCVYQWRLLQEQKLAARTSDNSSSHILSSQQVLRFISHYQRLTEHCLNTLPKQADWLFELGEDHGIKQCLKKDST